MGLRESTCIYHHPEYRNEILVRNPLLDIINFPKSSVEETYLNTLQCGNNIPTLNYAPENFDLSAKALPIDKINLVRQYRSRPPQRLCRMCKANIDSPQYHKFEHNGFGSGKNNLDDITDLDILKIHRSVGAKRSQT
ncbi:hypothetical protein GJ496_010617 [Pomphorhynchus laevis]|nr:hypothetical protein GJ496_010617 [Pomphorhynchus laevis]